MLLVSFSVWRTKAWLASLNKGTAASDGHKTGGRCGFCAVTGKISLSIEDLSLRKCV